MEVFRLITQPLLVQNPVSSFYLVSMILPPSSALPSLPSSPHSSAPISQAPVPQDDLEPSTLCFHLCLRMTMNPPPSAFTSQVLRLHHLAENRIIYTLRSDYPELSSNVLFHLSHSQVFIKYVFINLMLDIYSYFINLKIMMFFTLRQLTVTVSQKPP